MIAAENRSSPPPPQNMSFSNFQPFIFMGFLLIWGRVMINTRQPKWKVKSKATRADANALDEPWVAATVGPGGMQKSPREDL